MSLSFWYALTGVGLCGIGLYGWLVRRQLVRRVLAFNIAGSGIFLILVGFAPRNGAALDPVPQAMVLTGIVVAVASTALALALLRRWYRVSGETVQSEDRYE